MTAHLRLKWKVTVWELISLWTGNGSCWTQTHLFLSVPRYQDVFILLCSVRDSSRYIQTDTLFHSKSILRYQTLKLMFIKTLFCVNRIHIIGLMTWPTDGFHLTTGLTLHHSQYLLMLGKSENLQVQLNTPSDLYLELECQEYYNYSYI